MLIRFLNYFVISVFFYCANDEKILGNLSENRVEKTLTIFEKSSEDHHKESRTGKKTYHSFLLFFNSAGVKNVIRAKITVYVYNDDFIETFKRIFKKSTLKKIFIDETYELGTYTINENKFNLKFIETKTRMIEKDSMNSAVESLNEISFITVPTNIVNNYFFTKSGVIELESKTTIESNKESYWKFNHGNKFTEMASTSDFASGNLNYNIYMHEDENETFVLNKEDQNRMEVYRDDTLIVYLNSNLEISEEMKIFDPKNKNIFRISLPKLSYKKILNSNGSKN